MTFILFLIDRKVRRGVALGAAVVVCLGAGLSGCGSSSTSSTAAKTTGLKKRVLVSNQFASAVQLLDAQNDKFVTTIGVNSPTQMLTRAAITAVVDSSSNTLALINNTAEEVKQQPAMPTAIADIALSSDGKTAYAALRSTGQVAIINVADGSVSAVDIPNVARLVLSPNNTRLLAFSDDPQHLPAGNVDSFYVVDTASHAVVVRAGDPGAQPYTAVFNGDNQAIILNCAGECGGSAPSASIRPVDLTNALAPVLGAPVSLPGAGATAGFLSGTNLFVAGTFFAGSPAPGAGTLVVVNTATSPFTVSSPLTIPDGLHTRMALTSNNRLYVGSTGCLPVPVGSNFQGCLAIYDTTKGVTQTAITMPVFSNFRAKFSVTGLQPISGRNEIYVVEGGELDIFDITTNALTPNQLDVVGTAVDAVQIDP